ncbi:MAG TPA: NTP transferase domain-containing protein, partial [Cryobacterium sp.]|nr:NTP transferase domain-containing protein [Cryobacterium sp.]
RYGSPKALVRGDDGVPWLVRAAETLERAGCSPVIVVLGAGGAEAEALLGESGGPGGSGGSGGRVVVHAADWAEGLAASLRAGLRAASALRPEPVAVAVVPVDVPDLDAATVARLICEWPQAGGRASVDEASVDEASVDRASVDRDTLRQAVFGGRPGHPVVIGRRHWAALVAHLAGDTGARPYLVAHGVQAVECGDLGTGADVDRRSGSNGDAGV